MGVVIVNDINLCIQFSEHIIILYYLGLGTSTSKEAKEYFSDMKRHRIPFRYTGGEDDEAIKLVCDVNMEGEGGMVVL